jgi:pectate lyase
VKRYQMDSAFYHKRFLLFIVFFLSIFSGLSLGQEFTIYEAEEAELYKAVIESEHSGYTGEGYVTLDDEPYGYVQWKISMADAGVQTINIVYANNEDEELFLDINVNDVVVYSELAFPCTEARTVWSVVTVTAELQEGVNIITLKASTDDGYLSIDRIEVSGEKGLMGYELELVPIGAGEIIVEPEEPNYIEGAIVELAAEPNVGWSFAGWSGDLSGSENPIAVTMDSDLDVVALFRNDNPDANNFDALVGFAAAEGDGLSTTTGGQGGDIFLVTSGEQLNMILRERKGSRADSNYPPVTVIVKGTLTFIEDEMMDVEEADNMSFLGKGADAIIEGFGLNIDKCNNIIVRNIEFRDCPDDAINITNESTHHVWIDHCTFSDSPDIDPSDERHDGLLDIKHGASYITVSWNHFYNHRKTCLLGHSDNNAQEDIGRLKVTYHHNWFDNTHSRHPRLRFGQCHVFNNYYDNSKGGMDYGIASTQEADVVVEANYFKNVRHPMYSGYGNSGPGDIVEFDNIYDNSGLPQIRGDAFEPLIYYLYVPDNSADVPSLVMERAGSGKIDLDITTSIDY